MCRGGQFHPYNQPHMQFLASETVLLFSVKSRPTKSSNVVSCGSHRSAHIVGGLRFLLCLKKIPTTSREITGIARFETVDFLAASCDFFSFPKVCDNVPNNDRLRKLRIHPRCGEVAFFLYVSNVFNNVQNVQCVGRTHTIVRLQRRIRRKDGTENFGGFVFVLDGFAQRDFVLWVLDFELWVFVGSFNFSESLFRLPHQGLQCPTGLSFPAPTPRATTAVQIHSS